MLCSQKLSGLNHLSLRLRDSNLHLKLMRLLSCPYSKPQFFLCWLNQIWTGNFLRIRQLLLPLSYEPLYFIGSPRIFAETFIFFLCSWISLHFISTWIASSVVKHFYLLNYEQMLWGLQHPCLPADRELKTIIRNFPFRKKGKWSCCLYTNPYWLTPGLEPCYFRSQRNALPVKLVPTFFAVRTVPIIIGRTRQQIDNLWFYHYSNEPYLLSKRINLLKASLRIRTAWYTGTRRECFLLLHLISFIPFFHSHCNKLCNEYCY